VLYSRLAAGPRPALAGWRWEPLANHTGRGLSYSGRCCPGVAPSLAAPLILAALMGVGAMLGGIAAVWLILR
jgi:hypothetical protein